MLFPERPGNPAPRSPSPVWPWPAASSGGPCGPRHPNPQLGDGSSWWAGHTCNAYTETHHQLRTKSFGGGVQLREALLPTPLHPSLVADLQNNPEDVLGPRYGQQGPFLLSPSPDRHRGQQAWACNASSLHFRASSLHTLSLSILSCKVWLVDPICQHH